jgi:hypothetical protein
MKKIILLASIAITSMTFADQPIQEWDFSKIKSLQALKDEKITVLDPSLNGINFSKSDGMDYLEMIDLLPDDTPKVSFPLQQSLSTSGSVEVAFRPKTNWHDGTISLLGTDVAEPILTCYVKEQKLFVDYGDSLKDTKKVELGIDTKEVIHYLNIRWKQDKGEVLVDISHRTNDGNSMLKTIKGVPTKFAELPSAIEIQAGYNKYNGHEKSMKIISVKTFR